MKKKSSIINIDLYFIIVRINNNFFCFNYLAVGQLTVPPELPIFGDADTEISLDLIFVKTEPIFSLSGKTLKLLKPLDRDKDNLSHIVFQVCQFHLPLIC
jgi:hypothetical protein